MSEENTSKSEQGKITPEVLVKQNSLVTPQELIGIKNGGIIEVKPADKFMNPHQTIQGHRVIMGISTNPYEQKWIGSGKFRVLKNQTLRSKFLISQNPNKYGVTEVSGWTLLECVSQDGKGNGYGDVFAFHDEGAQIQDVTSFKFNSL